MIGPVPTTLSRLVGVDVPLSRQAMEIIAELRGLSGHSPCLFPSAWWHHEPMSNNALAALLRRAGFRHEHVPHGWRATFSTIMNERHPADRHVIEAILAHVPENQVAAAYNRALYLDRRREILQEWASLVTHYPEENSRSLGDAV